MVNEGAADQLLSLYNGRPQGVHVLHNLEERIASSFDVSSLPVLPWMHIHVNEEGKRGSWGWCCKDPLSLDDLRFVRWYYPDYRFYFNESDYGWDRTGCPSYVRVRVEPRERNATYFLREIEVEASLTSEPYQDMLVGSEIFSSSDGLQQKLLRLNKIRKDFIQSSSDFLGICGGRLYMPATLRRTHGIYPDIDMSSGGSHWVPLNTRFSALWGENTLNDIGGKDFEDMERFVLRGDLRDEMVEVVSVKSEIEECKASDPGAWSIEGSGVWWYRNVKVPSVEKASRYRHKLTGELFR